MSFRLWINWTRQNKALILKKCLSGSKIHPLLRRYQGLHMSDVLISVFCGYFFFINSPVRTLKAGLDGEVGYCEVNLVTAYYFWILPSDGEFPIYAGTFPFFVTTENKIDWTLFTLDATGLTVFVCFFIFSRYQCYFRFRHYPGVKKQLFYFSLRIPWYWLFLTINLAFIV